MPDENKFHLLKAIGWKEQPVCGQCVHFRGLNGDWGTCKAFSYHHTKHNGSHFLGVHAYGGCDDFERDNQRADRALRSYTDENRDRINNGGDNG